MTSEMMDIKVGDAEIRRKIEETLKDKATMRKLAHKAVTEAIEEASKSLQKKIRRNEIIEKIIEGVIPRQYSGYGRDRMKRRVRELLRKNHKI